MFDLQKFYIERNEESDTEGIFILGPLPRGYGYTVANPIRRILLASIEGAAITSVKINGVEHEYTTMEGVQDDVLAILLSLKNVAIRSYSDEPVRGTVSISTKKGEVKEVLAKDIEVDASVEIINKDYKITTVSDGAKLEMELMIEKGRGFKADDEAARSEIGMIPVDGIYNPVENVQVKVSNVRVGQETDWDQIEFRIKTNGVVTPTQSLTRAIEIFNKITTRLVELSGGEMEGEKEEEEKVEVEEKEEEVGIPVASLNLSTRLKNALTNSAITDLRLLDGKTKDQLLEIKGMGEKSVEELIDIMQEHELAVIEAK